MLRQVLHAGAKEEEKGGGLELEDAWHGMEWALQGHGIAESDREPTALLPWSHLSNLDKEEAEEARQGAEQGRSMKGGKRDAGVGERVDCGAEVAGRGGGGGRGRRAD